MKVGGRQSDPWRPPEAWECTSEEVVLTKTGLPKPLVPHLRPSSGQKPKSKSPTQEMTHLQRRIRRMEAASAKIVLERLKEEWTEMADASVYRELELEKQLWMLSALRSLNKAESAQSSDDCKTVVALGKAPGSTKLLSLYENHGMIHPDSASMTVSNTGTKHAPRSSLPSPLTLKFITSPPHPSHQVSILTFIHFPSQAQHYNFPMPATSSLPSMPSRLPLCCPPLRFLLS